MTEQEARALAEKIVDDDEFRQQMWELCEMNKRSSRKAAIDRLTALLTEAQSATGQDDLLDRLTLDEPLISYIMAGETENAMRRIAEIVEARPAVPQSFEDVVRAGLEEALEYLNKFPCCISENGPEYYGEHGELISEDTIYDNMIDIILRHLAPFLAVKTSDKTVEAVKTICQLLGNVDHSKGNGANSAKMRGELLNDIRTIAQTVLED